MYLSEFGIWHWVFVVVFCLAGLWIIGFNIDGDDGIDKMMGSICMAVVIFIALFVANEFTPSEEADDRAHDKAQAIAAKERQTPRKVNEFDGCTLYSFDDSQGRENFITRCPLQTITESKHTRTQGKSTVTDNKTIETVYD